MGLQRVGHNWVTELNWTELMGLDAMILLFWMLSLSQIFHSPLSHSLRGSLVPLAAAAAAAAKSLQSCPTRWDLIDSSPPGSPIPGIHSPGKNSEVGCHFLLQCMKVPLSFLQLKWYHLHICCCWYFSQQSWFQLVLYPAWHFTWCMYIAWKLNRQGDNIQPWCTPFPILNQSVVPCLALTVASCPAYRLLGRWVRLYAIPTSWRILRSLLWSTQSKTLAQSMKQRYIFSKFLCFFYILADVGNLLLVPLPFSKSSLYIWKFLIHILLKPSLKDSKHNLATVWNEHNCMVVCTFFGIALLWDWNENWPFLALWPLLSFPNLLTYRVQQFNSILIFQD